jgi:hypothetical protein
MIDFLPSLLPSIISDILREVHICFSLDISSWVSYGQMLLFMLSDSIFISHHYSRYVPFKHPILVNLQQAILYYM